jgi:5-methyltetrahydrofolate--homocysteine methyltransferase
MTPFLDAVRGGDILISDGAMGTQLAARGAIQGTISNLEFPDIVKAIHADYKNAGARVILTNTLTANRISLEHAGLADKVEQINTSGAALCREAVGDTCYIVGDMTSTGKFMEPLGDYTEAQFAENAAEQARYLADAGVDLIIVETMADVRETCVSIRAAKEATGLPVIASISFDLTTQGFRTMMGDTVDHAVSELTKAGADVIGANCGTIDPFEMSDLIAQMRAVTDMPIAAQPNAGKPELSAGEVTFRLTPDEFADGIIKCKNAGATLLGGCCGTTPAHIAALAQRLRA